MQRNTKIGEIMTGKRAVGRRIQISIIRKQPTAISGKRIGDLLKIEGKLTGEKYRQILKNHAVSSGLRLVED